MIVSWDWLSEYVELGMSHDQLVDRLTMSGLNHEGSETVGDDTAIDLEVTSNRPDCLGHFGVAREVAVLFKTGLNLPQPQPSETGSPIADDLSIELDCDDLCYRFTARLIRGVKIGPSPEWMVRRLQSVFPGYKTINNVADITNYVMMECGQPLHAFDFSKIRGNKIVVRRGHENEEFEAINHETYKLDPQVCVIADADRAVGIGGVMGGADTEVSEDTVDVLIEAAEFSPMSIRATARKLNLHSPASHRFERPIDPRGTDYASLRCCQLVQEFAGGELAKGIIDVGKTSFRSSEVSLRYPQLKRILGIEIPAEQIPRILGNLGCRIDNQSDNSITVVPPTWRRDLVRECDLIEEVGRIYGFDKVPENADVPMAATLKRSEDRVSVRVRNLMTAAGFDEAMTASLVPAVWSDLFTPWTDQPPLVASQPMLGVLEKASKDIGRVEFARRSLLPSLLEARRINEHRGGVEADLFELAKVYLPTKNSLPREPVKISFVTSRDYQGAKGIVDSLFEELNLETKVDYNLCEQWLLDRSRGGKVLLGGSTVGYVGEVSEAAREKFQLRKGCAVGEVDFQALLDIAELVPQHRRFSDQPATSRDFNFIVEESVRWAELSRSVTESAGANLESVQYLETFRNPQKDGDGKKRVLLSVTFRGQESTLTSEEVEKACDGIIQACKANLDANLVS